MGGGVPLCCEAKEGVKICFKNDRIEWVKPIGLMLRSLLLAPCFALRGLGCKEEEAFLNSIYKKVINKKNKKRLVAERGSMLRNP